MERLLKILTVLVLATAIGCCPEDGKDGRNGKPGAPGAPGIGLPGLPGLDGTGCTVQQLSNGALITCGSTSAVVVNGVDGIDGTDGEDGEDGTDANSNVIGIAGYIKPCGDEFNNDEIFLRLTDNKILALYDGGPHLDRLVLLAPGNYVTTDRNGGQTCHFTVTNSLQITNESVH